MRYILTVCAILVVIYLAWEMSAPEVRKWIKKQLARHLPRIGVILLCVFALVVLAYYLPVTAVLF